MKVLFAALLSFVASASAIPEIDANSALGKNLVHHARRVEQNQDNWEEQNNWVSTYSVKFQGCMNIKQWNDEADGEEDVRIATKSLVRFRLCPTDTCSSSKAAGCTSGFGDYIIDMDTYMQAHIEAVNNIDEVECENFVNGQCDCEDDDDKDDGFDRDFCEYDCLVAAGMYKCIERNPYDDDEQEEQFKLEEYMECKEIEVPEEERRRRLEDGQEEEVQYFVGPYCGNQGGEIYLGLFSEDTCTEKVEDVSFEDIMGYELPYESKSLVGSECVSCIEPVRDEDQNNNNNNNNGDEQDADEVIESCEILYQTSGKCESNLPSGVVYSRNENACTYMEGVKIVRHDGIIDVSAARPSAVATAFIVIFAMAFAAMAFYVWYLRTRLGVKQNTLL